MREELLKREPNTGFGIRDIFFVVLGILCSTLKNMNKIFPGIYIQIGIDLIAENRNMTANLIDWSFLFMKRLSEGLHKSDSYSN
jgi:hypothetical protein